MIYPLKVRFLKTPLGHRVARRWRQLRTGRPRAKGTADYMTGRVEGRSFADVGCMWKINGEHSFMAEARGATRVVGLDISRTEAFDERLRVTGSKVEFVQADATEPGALAKLIGPVDVVWCFGVLYHVPDPLQLLRNLREICLGELILETFTAPEVPGLSGAAWFFPYLPESDQRVWMDARRAQGLSISKTFDQHVGYSNNFWALAPSAVCAALKVSGFEVTHHEPSLHGSLRTVFFARPVDVPEPG